MHGPTRQGSAQHHALKGVEEDLAPPNDLFGRSDDDAQDCGANEPLQTRMFRFCSRKVYRFKGGPMYAEKFLFCTGPLHGESAKKSGPRIASQPDSAQ